MSDLLTAEEIDQKEWIDYLKIVIEPLDSVASWRYVKKLQNITCKERLENITWRKYSEKEKYSLKLLDQGLKSPSTMHLYFSRGFLNGPLATIRNQSTKLKRKKRKLISPRSIRFKETVDYRSYSQEDTMVEIPSDLENGSCCNQNFDFIEWKERIKTSKAGSSLLQKVLRNLSCRIKSLIFGFADRKKGVIELLCELIFGRSSKSQLKNIPWEPTVLIEEKTPLKKVKDGDKLSGFLDDLMSYSEKQIKTSLASLYKWIKNLSAWTYERLYYHATGIGKFLQELCSRFKQKVTTCILTIGNMYTAITSTIRQLFSVIHYILVITYPYALYLYQRIKKRISRSLILAFHVVKRLASWKKSIIISDLPTEIKWEIVKHLDYKSASRFCRVLNIGEFDCLQYHQFFIHPPLKAAEFGIINCVFTIIGWLFYQPQVETSTEVDIWTVSYVIEKMIGSDEEKFSVLVRNENFRNYVGDEIVLALSCKYGDYSTFCQLIADSKNDPSIGMDYPVRWAAFKGQTEIIKLLLKDKRVDPSIDNNKPLISACEHGHAGVVDALLTHSAVDPASQSNYAIEKACYNGHQDVVRRLLKDPRVDPTTSRNYCLKLACKRNHLAVVRILLSDSRIRPREDDYKLIQRLLQRQNSKQRSTSTKHRGQPSVTELRFHGAITA